MVKEPQEEEDHLEGFLSAQERIWRKAMIYFQQTLTESGVGSTKLFGWEQDIVACFLYIPPSDSNWYRNGKSFNYDLLN